MTEFDMYNMDFSEGLKSIWSTLTDAAYENFRQGLGVFVTIIIISMLIGLADAVFTDAETDASRRAPVIAGILVIAGVCIGNVHSLFGLVTETLSQTETFSKALLPTLSAAMTAAGTPTSAIVKNSAIVLFGDVLITIINRVMLPCTYAYLALITANAALGNDMLKQLSYLIKSGISGALKLLLTLFVAYITVSGTISGTSDAVLERGTKLALTGTVPVVGGIIAEASQTVLAGAGVLRNSIGIFGLIMVLSITISPIIKIGLNFLALKFAAAVASPASPAGITKYIENLSDIFALMLGMTAASTLVLLIGIVSCMQAGVG